jgi:hypothetical protein
MRTVGAGILLLAALSFSAMAANGKDNGNATCGEHRYRSNGGCLDSRDKETGNQLLREESPWS